MSKEELTCKTPNNKILVSNSFDENCLIWINSKVMCISETINRLEQQVKGQKEVIDKAIEYILECSINEKGHINVSLSSEEVGKLLDILKEVSE